MDTIQVFEPTPYKISTITATGSVNTSIDLQKFFDYCNLEENETKEGIIYIEFGTKKTCITTFKGIKKKNSKKNSKRFDNQVTVLCRLSEDKVINVKVFKNGNIQMTGIKSIEQGESALGIVVESIKDIFQKCPTVVSDIELLKGTNICIHLINSDFKTGIEINRENINSLLQTKYDIYSCFERSIYPGVKVQYFWQQNDNTHGVCNCKTPCNGKGKGNGDGDCKKITIAIFQSGCIIITGASQPIQINHAYTFICDVIKNNMNYIKKKKLLPLA